MVEASETDKIVIISTLTDISVIIGRWVVLVARAHLFSDPESPEYWALGGIHDK